MRQWQRVLASIRFFCRALPPGYTGPVAYWRDRALEYLPALRDTGYGVRALTMVSGGIDLGDLKSPWYQFREFFSGPVAERYVNVVCGDNGEVQKYFTVGVPNVAITGMHPTRTNASEVQTLRLYDEVFCPSNEDAAALRGLGVERATFMPPDAEQLRAALRRFLDGDGSGSSKAA